MGHFLTESFDQPFYARKFDRRLFAAQMLVMPLHFDDFAVDVFELFVKQQNRLLMSHSVPYMPGYSRVDRCLSKAASTYHTIEPPELFPHHGDYLNDLSLKLEGSRALHLL